MNAIAVSTDIKVSGFIDSIFGKTASFNYKIKGFLYVFTSDKQLELWAGSLSVPLGFCFPQFNILLTHIVS